MKNRAKKRTQLIYDKNTKIISIKEEDKKSLRLFLERNKVFFETILMFVISIVGIIVSIVGISVTKIANDISMNEQRINNLEKQPCFIFELESGENELLYTIKNTGEDIKEGDMISYKILIVSLYDDNQNYLGKALVYIGGYFKNRFSSYDFVNKNFVIHRDLEPKPIFELIENLVKAFESKNFYCDIDFTEYFELTYLDYKQDRIYKEMILEYNNLIMIEQGIDYDIKEYISINEYDNQEQIEIVTERLIKFISRPPKILCKSE